MGWMRAGTWTGVGWLLARVCVVGLLQNLQPSEPYLTSYLRHDKHLTDQQLNNEVYPFYSWSEFAFVLPAGIVAEVFGYRAMVGVGLLARQVTRMLLLWGGGVEMMALVQCTYGLAKAINGVVYFSFIYTIFAPSQYQKATSAIHASYSIGNVIGSLLGELLVVYYDMRLQTLFYWSWAFTSAACLAAFALPASQFRPPPSLFKTLVDSGFGATWAELRGAFSSPTTIQWSLWWWLAKAGYTLASNYYSSLYYNTNSHIDNFGVLEAMNQLAVCLAAFLPFWAERYGGFAPSFAVAPLASLAAAGALVACTLTRDAFWVSASCYVAFVLVYSGALTLAASRIATSVESSRFSVVFAANSFAGLAVASAVQALITGLTWSVVATFWCCVALYAAASVLSAVCLAGFRLLAARGPRTKSLVAGDHEMPPVAGDDDYDDLHARLLGAGAGADADLHENLLGGGAGDDADLHEHLLGGGAGDGELEG